MSRRIGLLLALVLLASTGAVAQEKASRCDVVPAFLPGVHAVCVTLLEAGPVEGMLGSATTRSHMAQHTGPVRVPRKPKKKGRPPGRMMPVAPPAEPA